MPDVEPRLYPTVIREMIRHENDVTNHRIMWLLIGQGLIANAYVGAGNVREEILPMLAAVGILVTVSTFIILYKSYQARVDYSPDLYGAQFVNYTLAPPMRASSRRTQRAARRWSSRRRRTRRSARSSRRTRRASGSRSSRCRTGAA